MCQSKIHIRLKPEISAHTVALATLSDMHKEMKSSSITPQNKKWVIKVGAFYFKKNENILSNTNNLLKKGHKRGKICN